MYYSVDPVRAQIHWAEYLLPKKEKEVEGGMGGRKGTEGGE